MLPLTRKYTFAKMKLPRSTYFKALFLLVIFSFNLMVGFACSIGIDMGYNKSHHHSEITNSVANHASGHAKMRNCHKMAKNNHSNQSQPGDDCCNHNVIYLSHFDKAVPASIKLLFNPYIYTPNLFGNYKAGNFYSNNKPDKKHNGRSHHPPIPDIRIKIQSFQI